MDAIVIKRIKDFLNSNPNYQNYISGVSAESNDIFIKNKQGKLCKVTIEDLENGRLNLDEFDKEEAIYDYKKLENGQTQRIIVAPKSLKNIEKEDDLEVIEDDFEPVLSSEKTMKDLNDAIISKNIEKIDEILITEYKNPNTGLIDISSAIKTVNENCIKQAAECIKDNKNLSSDLSDYDLKGILKSEPDKSEQIIDSNSIKLTAFAPVNLMLKTAELKHINIPSIEEFQKRFDTSIDDTYRLMTAVKTSPNQEVIQKDDEPVIEQSESQKLTYAPKRNATGFADIFILTAIILVYAAIIINLILKMR